MSHNTHYVNCLCRRIKGIMKSTKNEKRNLEDKWVLILKQIENSVSKLLENRYFFREFMDIVEKNPNLPANNFFIVWIWENYLLNAATGVRRMVDKDKRSVSLYLLLKDIKENPKILSRERYTELFKDGGLAKDYSYINGCFDKLVGKGKSHIDPKDVEKDIQLLLKIRADKLVTYVNKTIAHLDKNKIKKIPTIKDLDDSLGLFEKLVKKYYAIFHAGGIKLLPIPQVPWKNIFEIPWTSRKKGHGNE